MKKNQIKRIVKAITHPRLVIIFCLDNIAFLFPDKLFLKIKFFLIMCKRLDFDNPITYNEKLQWLKIYDRNPDYTKMVDKIGAKEYVAKVIGEEYIIPTIAIYNNVDEIDFSKLPDQFVIKCTHDSGGLVICTNKSSLNLEYTKKFLKKYLKRNYYYPSREWPYRNVIPKLIVEEYMVDESGFELKDYKLFCFDGKVKALFIATDRSKPDVETKFDFFDENFNHLPFTNGHPNAEIELKKPVGFEKMKELAELLSHGIPHVRVDFYDINGKIFFGELTFFHWGGLVPFEPMEWDYTFGSWITLPQKYQCY